MKIVQWEPSCSMRRGRKTDITKLIVAFRRFANAPKNTSISANLKIFRTINNSPSNDEKGQERNEPARILTQSTQDSRELVTN